MWLWQFFCGGLLEIGVALFLAIYFIRKNSKNGLDEDSLSTPQDQQHFHHDIATRIQEGEGCLKVLDMPLAPGIFATVVVAYVYIAMFLFSPLHPIPNDNFWKFVGSSFILTLVLFPPLFIMVMVDTATQAGDQSNRRGKFFRALLYALFLLIVGEIAVWFGIYA